MKERIKRLLFTSLLLIPTIVYASSGESGFSMPVALFMEAFVTIHMSLFVLKPIAALLEKEHDGKLFWQLFSTRIVILLICDVLISPLIAIVDFLAVFVGGFVVVPILAAVKKKNLNEVYSFKQTTTVATPETPTTTDVNDTSVPAEKTEPKQTVYPSNYDIMYSMDESKMVEEFINRSLKKADIDSKSNLIPSDILKRKKFLTLLFAILVFVYVTLIFFHFPLYTYIIGLIILLIFYKKTRKYDLVKYLVKQVKSRPGEKVDNIVMNVKNTFVSSNTKPLFLLSFVTALILPLIIFSSPRIIYEKSEGGYAVRYYIFGLTNYKTATIPETYKNEKVVSLRGNTFSNMTFLETVTLPDTIKEIRGQAFKNCKSLTKVNIPKNLEYLGGGAFYNASSIRRIELPDTLTYLGGESFYGARSLEYIKLSENLSEIRGDSFEYCTSLRSINIPDNVTRIGGHAFYGDTALSEVSISKNSKLAEIGSSAFRQCSSLHNITIPSSTYVNERAFKESPTIVNTFDDYIDDSNNYSYNNNSNIIDDSNKEVEDYYLKQYNTLSNKSKHTNDSQYIFKAGETVVFDKYEVIISVPRVSQNGKIDYVVNTTAKKYGTLGTDYNNNSRKYVYWNNCKISFVETGSLDELKIVVQSVDELGKSFKTAVEIELTQNQKYMVNHNTIGLTYKEHNIMGRIDEFNISLEGLTNCRDNKYRCNNTILSKACGFEEINDNFMIKYISASWDKLVLVVYYN